MRCLAVVSTLLVAGASLYPMSSSLAQKPGGVQPLCVTGCGGGGDTQPPWIFLDAPIDGGVVYTQYPYVEISMCDNVSLNADSRTIQVNGSDNTGSFSYTTGSANGCEGTVMAMSATSSVPLNLGSNTIYAHICDNAVNCTSQTWYVTRIVTPSGPVVARDLCLTIAVGPSAAYECGDLRVVHPLPAVRTLGKVRAPTLLYNSHHAHPFVSLNSDVTLAVNASDSVVAIARLKISGSFVQEDREAWSGTVWGGGGQAVTRRVMTNFSAAQLTGIYAYQLEVDKWTSGSYTAIRIDTGSVVIVNRSGSAFGAGWWLAGFEQLISQADGSFLWIDGDGDARRYVNAGSWSGKTWYVGRQVTAPDTLSFDGTTYTRLLKGGQRVQFNSSGYHIKTVNRLGYVTRFWVTGSRLDSIGVAPDSSLRYLFDYNGANGTLSAVRAPDTLAGAYRTTTIGTTGSRVRSITESTGDSVQFGYANGTYTSLITSRTDRRGNATSFTYGTGLKLEASSLPVPGAATITRTFCPAEVHVWDCGGLTSPDSTYTVYDGPRVDSSDVTHFWLDSLGAVRQVRDAYGNVTAITRGDSRFPALATQMQAPNGYVTQAAYDARGNIASATAVNPLGDGRNATSSYNWDQTWDQLTQVTLATGQITQFGISALNGNRLWVQDGRGASSRTTFGYVASGNGAGLVDTVTDPKGARTRLTYDGLGNVNSSVTPFSWTTSYQTDRIGRLTVTKTPITNPNSAPYRYDTTSYDRRDRVIREVTAVGDPNYPAVTPQTLTVYSYYDPESNRDTVIRWQTPDSTFLGMMVTAWRFDAANRPTVEIAPDGFADSTWYDPARNVIAAKSRNGQTMTMVYDRMNRLRRRSGPGVTYAQRTGPGFLSTQVTLTYDPYGAPHPYPWFPNAGTGYRVDSIVDTLAYDSRMGWLIAADNLDAKVHRTYFNNGSLQTDSLSIRNYTGSTYGHVYGLKYTYDLSGRVLALHHPAQLAAGTGMRDSVRYLYSDTTGELTRTYGLLPADSLRYFYDTRGDLVRANLPGLIWDSLAYDSLSRLTRDRIWNGSTSQYRAIDTLLRNTTLWYDGAPNLVTRARNTNGRVDTVSAGYSAFGHLTSYSYSGPARPDTSWLTVSGGLATQGGSYDPLGNAYVTSAGTGGEITPGSTYYSGASDRWYFHNHTGRADSMVDMGGRHGFLYDSSGNTVFSYQFAGSTQLNDLASYYAADGRLRAAEARTAWSSDNFLSSAWQVASEEYRYDALGRRVLVMDRRQCYSGGSDTTLYAFCKQGRIRRIVWEGSRELWEIQMPARTQDSLLFENDTAAVNYWAGNGWCPYTCPVWYDPNPLFGRLAYTYAGGVDRPASVTRLQLVRKKQNEAYSVWGPVAVAPHWNWRGGADFGTFLDGGAQTCTDASHCARIQWSVPAFANGLPAEAMTYFGTPLAWFGSLIGDKRDATGLHYRRNRYVDPTTGRFTQEDPIGLAGGMNLYGFAASDPITFTDPFGLECTKEHWTDCKILSGGIGPKLGVGIQGTLGSIHVRVDAVSVGAEVSGSVNAGGRGEKEASADISILSVEGRAGSHSGEATLATCSTGSGCSLGSISSHHVEASSNGDIGLGGKLGIVQFSATLHAAEAFTAVRGMTAFAVDWTTNWLRSTFSPRTFDGK